jgi:hypothetical protein
MAEQEEVRGGEAGKRWKKVRRDRGGERREAAKERMVVSVSGPEPEERQRSGLSK